MNAESIGYSNTIICIPTMIYFCYIPFDFDFDYDFYMNYSFSSIIFIYRTIIFLDANQNYQFPDAFIYFVCLNLL
jgi:hypothetical protein